MSSFLTTHESDKRIAEELRLPVLWTEGSVYNIQQHFTYGSQGLAKGISEENVYVWSCQSS